MKAAWQQAAVTSWPPPAAVGLTLNADRLTLLASTPKAKTPSVIPCLSQVTAAAPPPPFSPLPRGPIPFCLCVSSFVPKQNANVSCLTLFISAQQLII